MGLIDQLGRGPVALDTAIFIYFIEEHPRFMPALVPVFSAIDAGRLPAVTSALTLLETLVVPYRARDIGLAERYESLLSRSRGLTMLDVDRTCLRLAAQVRATFGTKTPDAIQIATALTSRASTFLTNDRVLPSIPRLRILQLADYG